MTKPTLFRTLLFLFTILLFNASCTSEDEAVFKTPTTVGNFGSTIDRESLVGSWKLTVMTSDVLVDLNDDGNFTDNLLIETDCFDEMGVIFYENGDLSTTNSKLDFTLGESQSSFGCTAPRTDTGTWEVEDDELIMNLSIDGIIYTNRKQLAQDADTFYLEVTKFESDQYVNDPGNTQASEIRILSLEYTRI